MLLQVAGYNGWDENRVQTWGEALQAWSPNVIVDVRGTP
jgi:hypothetical protein